MFAMRAKIIYGVVIPSLELQSLWGVPQRMAEKNQPIMRVGYSKDVHLNDNSSLWKPSSRSAHVDKN